MDGIRKSILFFTVAGIMLQMGRFSELVVEVVPSLARDVPAFRFRVVAVLVRPDAFLLAGEFLFCVTLLLFVVCSVDG